MIRLNDVTFAYEKSKTVLDRISFDVEKGDTLCIVGASGSGKSTLLRVIAGLLPLYSGSTTIKNKAPLEYIKKGKLSFMFQDPSLFPNLSVKENIALPLNIKRIKDKEKVTRLISLVGLSGYEDYLPRELSGGMKTRVSLARSFITDPEILLLDEPFSALDIGWKKILIEELIQIKKKLGTTLIMVTHDIQEAICLSNRFIVLGRNGKILDEHSIEKRHLKENGYMDITRVPKYFPADLSRIQTILSLDSEKEEKSLNEIESVLDLLLYYAGDDSHLDFYTNMQSLLVNYFQSKSKDNSILFTINKINEKATEKQKEIIENVFS